MPAASNRKNRIFTRSGINFDQWNMTSNERGSDDINREWAGNIADVIKVTRVNSREKTPRHLNYNLAIINTDGPNEARTFYGWPQYFISHLLASGYPSPGELSLRLDPPR